MRDLPDSIPDNICFIIKEKWGDMKQMSEALGLPYTSVYSTLTTGGLRALETLNRLAEPYELYAEDVAEMLLCDVGKYRDWKIKDLIGGRSVAQWSKDSGVSESCIYKLMAAHENIQIRNLYTIAKALEMEFPEWAGSYSEHLQSQDTLRKAI